MSIHSINFKKVLSTKKWRHHGKMSTHSIKRKHDYICMDISEKIGIILFSKLPLGNKLQRRRRKKKVRGLQKSCVLHSFIPFEFLIGITVVLNHEKRVSLCNW